QLLPDAQLEFLFRRGKTRELGGDLVLPRPQIGQEVLALRAGHGGLRRVGLELAGGDRDAGQRAALLVEHDAAQRAERRLGGGRRREYEYGENRDARETRDADHP